MCIAIFQPAGVPIKRSVLATCFANNPDGAGYMHSDGKRMVIRKGFFHFREFWRSYRHARRMFPKADFGVHFRIATHGSTCKDNSHPHRVFAALAMIHNGILPIHVPHDRDISDTRAFVEVIMRGLPVNFYRFPGIVELMREYIGEDNKIVAMHADGGYCIINEDEGEWDGGCWYSNRTYRYVMSSYTWRGHNSYGNKTSGNGSSFGTRYKQVTRDDGTEAWEWTLDEDEDGKDLPLDTPRCSECGGERDDDVERWGVCKACWSSFDIPQVKKDAPSNRKVDDTPSSSGPALPPPKFPPTTVTKLTPTLTYVKGGV